MVTLKKNLLYSSFSSILKFYSGSLIFILIARYISVSDFGVLNFGFSLGLIVSTCAEFGYSLMASRDIPQKTHALGLYIFNTLIQKTVVSILMIGIFITYLATFFNEQDLSIGQIFIIYGVCSSFIAYYQSLFRAKNYFHLELLTILINAIFITVIIFLLIINEWQVEHISLALVISRLIQTSIVVLVYHLTFKQENTFKVDLKIQKYLTKHSWSFGLHFIIGTLYFQVDTQMLNYFLGNNAVGLYQASFKFIMLLLICFEVVFQVYLPYIADQFKKSVSNTVYLLEKLIKYLTAISLLAFATIVLLNEFLIEIIFGETYIDSAPLMPILAGMVIIRVIASLYGILLTVGDFQHYRVKAVLVSFLFAITCNFYFIPKYGVYGAALVSIFTHLVLITMYVFFIKKHFSSSLINSFGKVKLLVSAILLIVFYVFELNWNTITMTLLLVIITFWDLRFKELNSILKYNKNIS